MSQTAALLAVSQEYVDEARTYGQAQYYKGVRDAFDAVFRACNGYNEESDAVLAARLQLADLSPEERGALLAAARAVLKERRAETVKESLSAV